MKTVECDRCGVGHICAEAPTIDVPLWVAALIMGGCLFIVVVMWGGL